MNLIPVVKRFIKQKIPEKTKNVFNELFKDLSKVDDLVQYIAKDDGQHQVHQQNKRQFVTLLLQTLVTRGIFN